MDPITEHNLALQRNGFFSAADLDANRRGRYSLAQINHFQGNRDDMRKTTLKYEDRTSLTASVIGVGLILLAVALDFNGNLQILAETFGDLFLPLMLCSLILALVVILVIIPHQYGDSVAAHKEKGTSLTAAPLEQIQTIEARAEVFSSRPGRDPKGQQPPRGPHLLQMNGIPFLIPDSLRQVIQPKRAYRVYAVHNSSGWILLSMETTEAAPEKDPSRKYAPRPVHEKQESLTRTESPNAYE